MGNQMFKKVIAWYRRPKSKTADFFESLLIIIPVAFAIRTVGFGLYQVPTGSMETTMLVGERFFADKLTPYFSSPKHGEVISFNDPTYPYSQSPVMRWWQMYVWGPSNWTKRVIGIPGGHIRGVIEDGKPVIYRNDEKLDEPYLNKCALLATYDPSRSRKFAHKSVDLSRPFSDQPYYRVSRDEEILGKRWATLAGDVPVRYPGTPANDLNDIGQPADIFDVILGPNQYWVMGDNRQGSRDSRFFGPIEGQLIHGRILLRLWSIDSDESWAIIDLLKHPIDFWRRVRWSRFFQIIH